MESTELSSRFEAEDHGDSIRFAMRATGTSVWLFAAGLVFAIAWCLIVLYMDATALFIAAGACFAFAFAVAFGASMMRVIYMEVGRDWICAGSSVFGLARVRRYDVSPDHRMWSIVRTLSDDPQMRRGQHEEWGERRYIAFDYNGRTVPCLEGINREDALAVLMLIRQRFPKRRIDLSM